MVFYIRFLKTPRLQKQKTGSVVSSALICITTDLGDAFLSQDADLLVTLHLAHEKKAICQGRLQWHAGKRELPISLGPLQANISRQAMIMEVTASNRRSPNAVSADSLLDQQNIPLVISGWSAMFGGPQMLVADKLVERRFTVNQSVELSIWEETGNSIARHIWDAAVASVMYLQGTITGDQGSDSVLQKLLQTERCEPLNVIELGSGCGIVGIALAELLPQCSVLLTDLPEVEEIVTKNINSAQPAHASEIKYRSLGWEEELPSDLFDGPSIDLVLVSDCTYNADSLPALVSVLSRLVQLSPHAVVLVALKRRHESESVFFDLMQSVGLHDLHVHRMELPSQHEQSDEIELHSYGIQQTS
ncbi:putative methyltransferase-domain-containing protein [Aspergillus karnatakaensis]|uniref:protein N-lysine methyltransferase family protein n=1 Tax=Aspergillus karnatakaensis TaxID=1810916 RepID=UPI003CCCF2FB